MRRHPAISCLHGGLIAVKDEVCLPGNEGNKVRKRYYVGSASVTNMLAQTRTSYKVGTSQELCKPL